MTSVLPSGATVELLAIFIAAMPGIAAMLTSAFEKAGINFSLNSSVIFLGDATTASAGGFANTSLGCA